MMNIPPFKIKPMPVFLKKISRVSLVMVMLLYTSLTLWGCGGSGGDGGGEVAGQPLPERSPYDFIMPVNTPLAGLTPEVIAEIKADVSAVRNAFYACEREVIDATEHLNLTNNQLRAVFAMAVANAIAPYGASGVVDLPGLLTAPMLDCDSYAVLSGFLLKELGVPMDQWWMVGFNGGAIANHAQTFITLNQKEMLLDPTAGLVVVTSLEDLLAGRPVKAGQMAWIYAHNDPVIRWSAAKYVRAMQWGSYRPEDMQYKVPFDSRYF